MTTTAELDIPGLLSVDPAKHDKEWLKTALGHAFDLEYATIPPYLYALWSVKDRRCDVADAIRGIVWQEMFHMAMVGNLMTNLGKTPELHAPAYPVTGLPGNVHSGLTVCLKGVSAQAEQQDDVLKTFMTIEKPENPLARAEKYPTIGKFYAAIKTAYRKHFPAQPSGVQVTGRIGGDEVFAIGTSDQMVKAIDLITEQGEGTTSSPTIGEYAEMAHYYRFGEVWHGKRIVETAPGKWRSAVTPSPDLRSTPCPRCRKAAGPTRPHRSARNWTRSTSSTTPC